MNNNPFTNPDGTPMTAAQLEAALREAGVKPEDVGRALAPAYRTAHLGRNLTSGVGFGPPQVAGQGDLVGNCAPGRGRLQPENLLGSGDCDILGKFVCNRGVPLDGVLTNMSNDQATVVSIDYPTLGTFGQARAALGTLYSMTGSSVTRYPTVGTATATEYTYTATFDNTKPSPYSVGIRIDWGVKLLSFVPFDLDIVTSGFVTPLGGVSVDRSVIINVTKSAGGVIYLPFAYRVTPPQEIALMSLGVAPNVAGSPATVTIRHIPLVPGADFSATVSFMTPANPIVAQWAQALGVMEGG